MMNWVAFVERDEIKRREAVEQTLSKVLKILEEIIKRRTGFKPTILDIEEAIEKVKELKGK